MWNRIWLIKISLIKYVRMWVCVSKMNQMKFKLLATHLLRTKFFESKCHLTFLLFAYYYVLIDSKVRKKSCREMANFYFFRKFGKNEVSVPCHLLIACQPTASSFTAPDWSYRLHMYTCRDTRSDIYNRVARLFNYILIYSNITSSAVTVYFFILVNPIEKSIQKLRKHFNILLKILRKWFTHIIPLTIISQSHASSSKLSHYMHTETTLKGIFSYCEKYSTCWISNIIRDL